MKPSASWYNVERVRQPGSVILRDWMARREAARRKPRSGTRMYHAARPSRLANPVGLNSSADTELATSLRDLRSRSRQLVRDASYAKRAKAVVQNNVIGTGVGLQSNVLTTRGELNTAVNDAIEAAWKEWGCADHCHTGGALHFHDMERMLVGQVFEAGEVFVRLHYQAFGQSKIPLALEVIEAERIAEDVQPGPALAGNVVRMGVEVDTFYRPVAYWIRERHPGEFRLGIHQTDRYERVPAEQIIHLKITERWPQTRGEPWLHTVIRKLEDIDGYSEAEIVAARGAANYFASIKLGDDPNSPVAGEEQEDGSRELPLEPGSVRVTGPGEELTFHAPNRPNSAMDPFMRLMLREVSAGTGPSYESLSRDYSQSNFSSSRLALLDDRDLWRVIQLSYIRQFRAPLHRIWLQQAVLGRRVYSVPLEAYATDAERYCLARFKPRGWSWVNPKDEVDAFVTAVRAGFTTVSDVVAATGDGDDLEDKLQKRERELKSMREKGLEFDTDPERDASGKPKEEPKPEPAAQPQPKSEEEDDDMRGADFIEGMRHVADAIRAQKAPEVVVNVPAPVVHVRAPEVHVAAPNVRVEPRIEVQPTDVQVQVAAPEVRLELKPEVRMDEVELHVHSTVEVPPVEETVQKLVRDENREVTEIHTRRVREVAGQ